MIPLQFEQQDLMNRFTEWSRTHTNLLRYLILFIVLTDIALLFLVFLKRKQILQTVEGHDRVEKLFILSFIATAAGGSSLFGASIAFLGLQSAGGLSLSGLTAVLLFSLVTLPAALVCFATFLVLCFRLFIALRPALPPLQGDVAWGVTPVLVVAFAFFVVSLPVTAISEVLGSVTGALVFIALPLFLVVKTYGRTVSAMGFRKPALKYLLLVLPLLPVLIAGNEIVYEITERVFGTFPMEELMESVMAGSPLLMGVYLGVVGPVGEEVFFRGFAYTALKRKYGVKRGIVISALFFGCYHLLPWQIPYAVVAGLVLAYVCDKTESLYPPIIFHIINNSLAVMGVWS